MSVADPPAVTPFTANPERRPRLSCAEAGAVSSVGRAPARQAGGHWFEPSTAHRRSKSASALRRHDDFERLFFRVRRQRVAAAHVGRDGELFQTRHTLPLTASGVRHHFPWPALCETRQGRILVSRAPSRCGSRRRWRARSLTLVLGAFCDSPPQGGATTEVRDHAANLEALSSP